MAEPQPTSKTALRVERTGNLQDPAQVIKQVEDGLCQHSILWGYVSSLSIQFDRGTLRLSGQLPSFYLKQLLQTALKQIPGVDRIENQVVVNTNSGPPNGRAPGDLSQEGTQQ